MSGTKTVIWRSDLQLVPELLALIRLVYGDRRLVPYSSATEADFASAITVDSDAAFYTHVRKIIVALTKQLKDARGDAPAVSQPSSGSSMSVQRSSSVGAPRRALDYSLDTRTSAPGAQSQSLQLGSGVATGSIATGRVVSVSTAPSYGVSFSDPSPATAPVIPGFFAGPVPSGRQSTAQSTAPQPSAAPVRMGSEPAGPLITPLSISQPTLGSNPVQNVQMPVAAPYAPAVRRASPGKGAGSAAGLAPLGLSAAGLAPLAAGLAPLGLTPGPLVSVDTSDLRASLQHLAAAEENSRQDVAAARQRALQSAPKAELDDVAVQRSGLSTISSLRQSMREFAAAGFDAVPTSSAAGSRTPNNPPLVSRVGPSPAAFATPAPLLSEPKNTNSDLFSPDLSRPAAESKSSPVSTGVSESANTKGSATNSSTSFLASKWPGKTPLREAASSRLSSAAATTTTVPTSNSSPKALFSTVPSVVSSGNTDGLASAIAGAGTTSSALGAERRRTLEALKSIVDRCGETQDIEGTNTLSRQRTPGVAALLQLQQQDAAKKATQPQARAAATQSSKSAAGASVLASPPARVGDAGSAYSTDRARSISQPVWNSWAEGLTSIS